VSTQQCRWFSVAETMSPLRRMGPALATATGGSLTPLLSPWKTPHSLYKQWALRSHRWPLDPLQFPPGSQRKGTGGNGDRRVVAAYHHQLKASGVVLQHNCQSKGSGGAVDGQVHHHC